MNHRAMHVLGMAAIIAAVFGAGCRRPATEVARPSSLPTVESTSSTDRDASSPPINADAFLDIARFHAADEITSVPLNGKPLAGVVNHHVLASDLLMRFFRSLHDVRPDLKRVIILSPDHFKRGTDAISVSSFPYLTEGWIIPVDATTTHVLSETTASMGSRELVENEHGVGALIPFLVQAGCACEVVPIMIRADVSTERAEAFGVALAPFMDEHTIVIVSSDMSHYLSEREALANDVQTEEWLRNRDISAMDAATDDFTDNGPAFVALFSLFDALHISPRFERIDHSISSRYGADPNNTTSYITGVWE
jgi:AmmeMemoRadiSam system protein B